MGAAGTEAKSAPILPILGAMVLGAIVGVWINHAGGAEFAIGSTKIVPVLDLIGGMFINLLKMIIVPLILASVITGVAGLGSGPDLGKLGVKTLLFYVVTTLLSVLLALAVVNIVVPGVQNGQPVKDLLARTGVIDERPPLRSCIWIGTSRMRRPARWATTIDSTSG